MLANGQTDKLCFTFTRILWHALFEIIADVSNNKKVPLKRQREFCFALFQEKAFTFKHWMYTNI